MSDRDAFLRAIRANPDDDTARLVFADWLDERDDPLGEFIRVQIELEPIRHRIDNPRAVELHRREGELLARYTEGWLGGIPKLPGNCDFGPHFRRGLPAYACLSLDTFLTHGEALFAACPTLHEIALYDVTNRCEELADCPLLARVHTLEIADWPTEHDAEALVTSPYLEWVLRFKLWVGGEPWLLRALVRQATDARPPQIELVQLCGGIMCPTAQAAQALNDAADRYAREANENLGRNAVRITRPFERLFPLKEV